jgi:hypothetical protein
MLKLNPGADDHEAFINIQITSAGVHVRDAAVIGFKTSPDNGSVI